MLDNLVELDDLEWASAAIQQTVRESLGRTEVSDEVCARLALLALNKTVRDHAWAMITHEDADEHAELWRRVVARVPPVVSAAPLGLLGMAGWIGGHGALQNVCGERLAEIHPGLHAGRDPAGSERSGHSAVGLGHLGGRDASTVESDRPGRMLWPGSRRSH